MKEIFDFSHLKSFFKQNPAFTVLFDGMHGVTGPYATAILVDELELPKYSTMNCIPMSDFGGGHPDPNLTYAQELVHRVEAESMCFGAASDGDGDRNMIIGKGCFVNPSDSIAGINSIFIPTLIKKVIAACAKFIPFFQKFGLFLGGWK
jgi:phosphoglucomutase